MHKLISFCVFLRIFYCVFPFCVFIRITGIVQLYTGEILSLKIHSFENNPSKHLEI